MSYPSSDYHGDDLSCLIKKAGPIASGQGADEIGVAHILLALMNNPELLPEDGAYGGGLSSEQVLQKLTELARRWSSADV